MSGLKNHIIKFSILLSACLNISGCKADIYKVSLVESDASVSADAQNKCIPLFAFYPAWQTTEFPISKINFNNLSGIAVGFALPKPDGTIDAEQAKAILPELVTEAHNNKNKVYLSIGGALGYDDAFIKIAADSEKTKIFIRELNDLIVSYKLDGIDIDWEYWTRQSVQKLGGKDTKESPLLTQFIRAIREGLPKNIFVSTDVIAGSWVGEQFEPDLSSHTNHVNFMAYDATGDWKESAIGHHASLKDVEAGINWSIKHGYKMDNFWLGLPAYGINFPNGKNIGAKQVQYKDILNSIPINAQKQALQKGRFENTYFETPQNIVQKVKLARKYKLGGMFFWELTQDSEDPELSLIATAAHELGNDLCKY